MRPLILLMLGLALLFASGQSVVAQPAKPPVTTNDKRSAGSAFEPWKKYPLSYLAHGKEFKFIAEWVANPYGKYYWLINKLKLNKNGENFNRPVDLNSKEYKGLSPLAKKLVISLMNIHGVDGVSIGEDYISLNIGDLFDWETIEPIALRVMTDLIATGKTIVPPEPLLLAQDQVKIKTWAGDDPPRSVIFYADRQLTNRSIDWLFRSELKERRRELPALGPVGERMVMTLFSLPEVDYIHLDPYYVVVFLKEELRWTQERKSIAAEMIRKTVFTSRQSPATTGDR